jgi:6,7-dimethyl-8-ribityllumazine synthase
LPKHPKALYRIAMAKTSRRKRQAEAPIPGARILMIEARFHDKIADALVAGARARLQEAQAEIEHVRVPGALEIPVAAAILLDAGERGGRRYDGVLALGCVIKGQTAHFDIVAGESARALMELGISGVPVGNGILTVNTEAQATARAKVSGEDKGGGAASAVLALVRIARGQKSA